MKGATAGQPGQVILADYPEPQAGTEDIILAPAVCGICTTDVKQVKKGAKDTRFALGHELVGSVVKACGSQEWDVGQRVAVAPYLPCGHCFYCTHGQETLCANLYAIAISPGGLVEQVLVPAELARRGMFALPDDLNLDVAALAEPLGCALKGIEDVRFQPGASLLVIGDGPMGQLVAAAARSLGAYPVIMAGMLEHRLKIARDYFADIVVDITKERLQNVVANCTDQRGADVVLVTVSSGDALAEGIAAVRPGGAVNAFAGVPDRTYIELDIRKLHYKQYFLTGSSGVTPTHMEKALQLLSAQHVEFARIITADFPFPHVAEAVNYVENRLGLKAIVTF